MRTNGFTGELFTTAELFDDFFDDLPEAGGFANVGEREDAWEAALAGLGTEGYLKEYDFRPNAAVHFIVVSDETRQTASVPDQEHVNLGGVAPVSQTPLLTEILDDLRHENIDAQGLELLNDVVVTVVAPFWFVPDAFGADQTGENDYYESVLGVDAHIFDEINLDLNSADPLQDVQPGKEDDYIVFKWQDHQSFYPEEDNRIVADDNSGEKVLVSIETDEAMDYQYIRDLFNIPCDGDATVACFKPNGYPNEVLPDGSWNPFLDPDLQELGQKYFSAEEYAFLAWEARGTAWDFGHIQDAFTGWIGTDQQVTDNRDNFAGHDDENSMFSMMNEAFVDDTFEKIKLQIADFDRSGASLAKTST